MARLARQKVLYLPMRVWDAPTRLFHWLVVLLLPACYVAAKAGLMEWHFRSGYALLTLVLFRLVWGFWGSETSRFARFLVSPVAGLRHLAQFGRREPDMQVGHNAAGGWMVLVMLLLLAIEIGSGLCANDGLGLYEGPLAKYAGEQASDIATVVHGWTKWVLFAAIGLHIVAIVLYAVIKKQNLVRPMITGKKRLPAATRAPRLVGPARAILVLIVSAGVALVVARL